MLRPVPTALRVLAATGGGWLIGGQLGALVGFLGAVVASLSPSLAGAYVVAAAVLTGAATLFEARFGGLFASARFVRERPLAGDIGRLTGVLLLAWLIAARPQERPSVDGEDVPADDEESDGAELAGRPVDGPVADAIAENSGAVATARSGIRRLRGPSDATSGRGHLVSGSAWVMMGFLAQAVTGVGFWVLAARMYSQVDVGVASGLFTSLQFINYATALGLQELLSRYRPETRGDPLLGWSTLATMASSMAGTAIYLGLVGRGGDNSALSALTGAGAPAILGFVGVAASNAIAALADARMMWAKKWSWVFWRLALAGAIRLPLVLIPAAATADTADGSVGVWLFFVMAAPIALSGLVSLYLLRRAGNPPLSLDRPETGWNGPLRYAGVNYLSHLAILAPQFILPVIVFVNVRAVTYANFFLAWSIAAVAFILPVTIGRVFLVEGSRTTAAAGATRQAAMLAVGSMLVATVGAGALALLLPAIYGADYTEAGRILPWLVAGGIPWSVTSIALARARVHADSLSIVVMTTFAAVSVLGLAMWLVPQRDLDGAIAAWGLGNAVASAVAVVLVSIRNDDGNADPVSYVAANPEPR
jgi:O-antigen/teichoic acid export membrane protein